MVWKKTAAAFGVVAANLVIAVALCLALATAFNVVVWN